MSIVSTFYTPEYLADLPSRMEAKRNRSYTESPYVREVFDYMDSICLSPIFDQGHNRSTTITAACYKDAGIGYLNPKPYRESPELAGYHDLSLDEKGWTFDRALYTSNLPERAWDVRYCSAYGNEAPMVGELEDIPECVTDYADTIFVIDNPAYIDLLVRAGEIAKIAPDESADEYQVFLALHPDFVERDERIADIVARADAAGDVVDIRKWKSNGMLIEKQDKDRYNYFTSTRVFWHGPHPGDLSELDSIRRIASAVASLNGSLFQGYDFDGGTDMPWEDVPIMGDSDEMDESEEADMRHCLSMANALLMCPGYITLPCFERGQSLEADEVWERILRDNNINVENARPPKEAAELAEKVKQLEDACRIWKSMYASRRLALHFKNYEYKRDDFIAARIIELGRFLGMADYIDTLRAGVPVEDIMA